MICTTSVDLIRRLVTHPTRTFDLTSNPSLLDVALPFAGQPRDEYGTTADMGDVLNIAVSGTAAVARSDASVHDGGNARRALESRAH
jgi:hypothetical protein